MVTATLDGMAAGGFYDVVGGGFHRYSVDDRWLVPHFEKMLYDNAVLASTYLHAWVVTGRERYREIVEETLGYMLRELALPGGAFASAHDADTDGVEGLTYTWTPEEAAAVGLPQGRARALRARTPDRARRGRARAPAPRSRRARHAPAAVPRRQGPRLVERPRARGARRGGLPARARRLARGGARARRVPPRPAERGRRPASPLDPRRADERLRLSRRLRERRARPDRAACRNGRASLAARGAAARAPRRRALRGRRARRLLPLARRRRRARRAHEGPPGHADPVGELDARVRPPAPRADLGRRRARAESGVRLPPRGARAAPCSRLLRLDAVRDRPLAEPAARARDRRRRGLAGRTRRTRALPAADGRRRRPVRGGAAPRRQGPRRRKARCLRLRALRRATPPSPSRSRSRSDAHLPDDRRAGGRHLGRLGSSRPPHRGARARGPLPLRSLHRDHPARRGRPRRVGDARRARGDHGPHPARHDGLARDVPAPERPRADGRHGRPHLRRPRRGGDGLGLVRAGASSARLPVPRREAALRAVRGAGRGRRPLLDGGALRPRRPGVHAARPAGASAPGAAAAPAARSRRDGEAAVRGARGPLCDRGEHARRAERRAARAQSRARPRLRGGRARSRNPRLFRDDDLLPRRDARRRRRPRGLVPRDSRRRHGSGRADRRAPRPLARRHGGRGRGASP